MATTMSTTERNALITKIHAEYNATLEGKARSCTDIGSPDAADILQEAYIKMMRQAHTYDADRQPLEAWAVMIVGSVAALYYKKGTPGIRSGSTEFNADMVSLTDFENDDGEVNHNFMLDGGTDPLDVLIAEETADELRTALDCLPEKQHQAFVMREMEGITIEDIAEAMGVTVKAAQKNVERARATLQAVAEQGDVAIA